MTSSDVTRPNSKISRLVNHPKPFKALSQVANAFKLIDFLVLKKKKACGPDQIVLQTLHPPTNTKDFSLIPPKNEQKRGWKSLSFFLKRRRNEFPPSFFKKKRAARRDPGDLLALNRRQPSCPLPPPSARRYTREFLNIAPGEGK